MRSRYVLRSCDHAFFLIRRFSCATIFFHHMCFSFVFSFLTRLPHMYLSLGFQSNQSFNRIEPLHNFYCWKADMLLQLLVVDCAVVSCDSSSLHGMCNKVSRLSLYVYPLTKRHYLLLWATILIGKVLLHGMCNEVSRLSLDVYPKERCTNKALIST